MFNVLPHCIRLRIKNKYFSVNIKVGYGVLSGP
jgi:hypothetical protein